MSSHRTPIYFNPHPLITTTHHPSPSTSPAQKFHQDFPDYAPTPLVPLPDLATELGVHAVLVKNESNRYGLPSFKILGASWGTFRAVVSHLGLPETISLKELSRYIREKEIAITVLAATEGNHGRAVAFVAKLLGLRAMIFVPYTMACYTKQQIEFEGADVIVIDGDYDLAVQKAAKAAQDLDGGILVQDTAFPGYEAIPAWIVEGYVTILSEIDIQLAELGLEGTLMVTPVGVGSLAQAVATHCKARRSKPMSVVTVEPDTGACLYRSLRAGRPVSVPTTPSIMSGLTCGTVSKTAWAHLQRLVDASVTVSCYESHEAVEDLASRSIAVGPCGSASLAALRRLGREQQSTVLLKSDAVVVLLSTEGPRPYQVPMDVSVDDPVLFTQMLTRIDSSNPTLTAASGAGETRIIDYIAAWLAHRGTEHHRIETVPGRPSIVGVVRGTGGGKSLMLNGHVDTVSLASYETDALSGDIAEKNGKPVVTGRGSLDMKSGLATAMAAMVAATRGGSSQLRGDVILAAVADEEVASQGTQDLLAAGWRADAAVIPEPTMLALATAHKGFVWVEVDILGVAAHGSQPADCVDAIMHMSRFLQALEKYQETLPTDELLGKASLHCGLIRGGEEASSYPAKCTMTVEFRTVPGQTDASILQDVRDLLDEMARATSDFRYNDPRIALSRPPYKLSREHPLVRRTASIAADVLERPVEMQSIAFWCDAALLAEAGIPTIVLGPSGAGLHSKEEWVEVESIRQVRDILGRLIGEFCT